MSQCRLCLRASRPSIHIFEGPKKLSEKIQDCCGMTLIPTDGLSDKICFACEMKLTSFFKFKEMCVKNHFILTKRYKYNTKLGRIADTNVSIINDRSDMTNSPDVYEVVDEQHSLKDTNRKISKTTRFDCPIEPTPNSLPSVCRLCLQDGVPIYIFDESKCLPENIMDFCELTIKQNDGLPDQICFSCEMKLITYIELKHTWLRNNILLIERRTLIIGEILDSKKRMNEQLMNEYTTLEKM